VAFFGVPSARAVVSGNAAHSRIRGQVSFVPRREGVLVIADIQGLPYSENGFFAMHIHEGGDCRGKGFPNTGVHYNPGKHPHPRHAGDLPPLLSSDGNAYLAVLTSRFRVEDIIGKSLVIHDKPDDFKSQPAGDAGNKIACGLIRRV